jgi:hypothetical protein
VNIRIKYDVDRTELIELLELLEKYEQTVDRLKAKGYVKEAKEAMRLWPLIRNN